MAASPLRRERCHELVRVLCQCQRMPVLARLIADPSAYVNPDREEPFAGYVAECLKCKQRVTNNYNWERV